MEFSNFLQQLWNISEPDTPSDAADTTEEHNTQGSYLNVGNPEEEKDLFPLAVEEHLTFFMKPKLWKLYNVDDTLRSLEVLRRIHGEVDVEWYVKCQDDDLNNVLENVGIVDDTWTLEAVANFISSSSSCNHFNIALVILKILSNIRILSEQSFLNYCPIKSFNFPRNSRKLGQQFLNQYDGHSLEEENKWKILHEGSQGSVDTVLVEVCIVDHGDGGPWGIRTEILSSPICVEDSYK